MTTKAVKKATPPPDKRRLKRLASRRWMPYPPAGDAEILRQFGTALEASLSSGLRHFSAMDLTVPLPYSARLGRRLDFEERHLVDINTNPCD